MGRRKGPDINKIALIVKALYEYRNGLWIRQLSRICRIPLSTTSYYVDKVLRPILEDARIGDETTILRVIKLKDGIIEKLDDGENINSIIKYMSVLKKIYSEK